MKKYILTIMLLFCITGACSSSKKSSDSSETNMVVVSKLSESSDVSGLTEISGSLNYSGNEPFAIPTLFTTDNLSYKLMGDETFIKETYPELNGQFATLYGRIVERGSLTYFEVYYYNITD